MLTGVIFLSCFSSFLSKIYTLTLIGHRLALVNIIFRCRFFIVSIPLLLRVSFPNHNPEKAPQGLTGMIRDTPDIRQSPVWGRPFHCLPRDHRWIPVIRG